MTWKTFSITAVIFAFASPGGLGQRGDFDPDSSWRFRREIGERWGVEGMNLVDVLEGKVVEDAHIIVQGDLILAVGSGPLPQGVAKVTTEGRWVIPGLHDLHSHLQAASGTRKEVARKLLDAGVTVIRELALTTEYAVKLAADTASGKVVGPLVIPASSVFEHEAQRTSRGFGDAATARSWVQREALAGAKWIKIYNSMTPEALEAIAEETKRLGLKICGHTEDVPPLEAATLGVASLEHTVSLPLSCLVDDAEEPGILPLPHRIAWRWEHIDDDRCSELLEQLRELEVGWVPTLVVVEGMIKQGGHGFRGTLDPGIEDGLEASIELSAEWAVEHHRAGGLVGLGTDFPINGVMPGTSVHRELELLVERGTAEPIEALTIASIGSARILGLDHLLGAITRDRLAHFVVLQGDPTTDISQARNIELVVYDGRRHVPSSADN